ncbi:MAG: hypothetical protein KME31_31465 [Tolypothrix carrinoi HA7290-LM1]|jgi:hypothetical protein|nr:hypothetical protein [Tolypothrix carrinoi HA7290-LM1]
MRFNALGRSHSQILLPVLSSVKITIFRCDRALRKNHKNKILRRVLKFFSQGQTKANVGTQRFACLTVLGVGFLRFPSIRTDSPVGLGIPVRG